MSQDPPASAPSSPPGDATARQRIETSLDESLLVEAAAGTGKTTQLVRRLVAVLQEGKTTVERIVAVTFTRKAAGELKLRLRQELDEARSGAEVSHRKNLEEALARLEEARIGTIHSFCADILRERPVEARVDPAFVELDEEETARLYDRAFRTWIEEKLADMPEGLRRALSRLAAQRSLDGSSPIVRLREAGRGLIDWRDFPAAWRREDFDREKTSNALIAQVEAAAALSRQCKNRHDYLHRALQPTEAVTTWIQRSDKVRTKGTERDYDELEGQLLTLLRDLRRNIGWRGRGKWFAPGVEREEALRTRDSLITSLDDFKRHADADLASLLHDELAEVTDAYEDAKRKSGGLDFLDLLISTRDLVRSNAEVRRFLQHRFTHLFVDEFQDTDPLQAEILLLLAADDPEADDWRAVQPLAGKLFLVGDPKQSIYRFRRADVVLYQDIKERLIKRGVSLIHLTQSFRALSGLQEAINAAFRGEMTGERRSGQPDYVPLEGHRDAGSEQPQLIALPVPKPYAFTRVTARSIENSLPEAVGGFVAWLVERSGWKVEDPDPEKGMVPVQPRHIAFLFRRFLSWGNDVTRPYTRELEKRGIPHLMVGGRSFHQREEVEVVRAALMAVEWPDDELSVFATLRGSLFAIRDDLLLRYRFGVGPLHPFRVADDLDDDFVPIYEALKLLARLHRKRNRVPIVETINELLLAVRAHAGFALRPAGNQVLANVQRICDMARSFEVRGGLSFRGFVERLNQEASRGGATQSPVLEEGAEGVRIMTAHAAKGLEFPVVILADMTAQLSRAEPGLYVDASQGLCAQKLLGCSPWELVEQIELEQLRDRAEGVRLAYVAATRARDLLVVPAVGDAPWENGWVSPLNKAIYPPRDRCRISEVAPECPPFGTSSVLMRSPELEHEPDMSVTPGLHRPMEGEHTVVWWDPKALPLDVEGKYGVRQDKVLSADDPVAVAEGQERYELWHSRQRDAREDGAEPELDIMIATQAEEGASADEPLIDVEKVPKPTERPHGIRFGTLVHTVLRDVAFDADQDAIGALARLHARMLDATVEEVEAATAAIHGALAHPLMKRAAAAERCHREAPFLLEIEEGKILEGTIDLLFCEGGSWTVVDFKTDAETEDLGERYRRQLGWYIFAVEELMDAPARGVLLSL